MNTNGQSAPNPTQPTIMPGERSEPFMYTVAANLHRVLGLSREEQLALWRRVLDLYAQEHRPIHPFMRDLCQDGFVENLLENEIFWGLAGGRLNRGYYDRASDYLIAVYAAAALMAAKEDGLPLGPLGY